ncbi:MAG: leucine-rich repeat protein [Clostridiales bacterium]|nr:leucine-rich repeat protein [Clostridiales bacterium]
MKQGKKIFKTITAILTVALLATIGASILFKDNVKADSAEGEGWSYEDGTLTITSSSAFPEGVGREGYGFFSYRNSITDIYVDSSVTEIPRTAFATYKKLESLELPGVEIIHELAFIDCTSLESVSLGQEGVVLEANAFQGCSALKTISWEKIAVIGDTAFYKCSSLESVDLSNCQVLGSDAFNSCEGITRVELGNRTDIPPYAFSGCSSLTVIDLSKVEILGEGAFEGCSSLRSVTLGKNLTSIPARAFCYSGLTNIDLSSVEFLNEFCFGNCYDLVTVTLNSKIDTIPNRAFSECDSLEEINLSSVKYISSQAFYCCYSLSDLNLRNVLRINDNAFYYCSGLSEVKLESATVIDSYAFYYTNVSAITINAQSLSFLANDAFLNAPVATVNIIGSKSQMEQHQNVDLWYFNDATINYSAFDVFFQGEGYDYYAEIWGVNNGDTVDMPEDPEKEGLTFIGWYMDPDCKVLFDPNTPITQDLTLYPGWMKSNSGNEIFKGHSLSLEGDIGVKFYVILPSGTSSNAYMEFSVQGISGQQKVSLKNALTVTMNNVTYKVFKCGVPAKNMTSVIHAELKDNNTILATNEYTVKEYAKYIIEHQDLYDGVLIQLVKDMVNYGSAAQTYFAHKAGKTVDEDKLANSILEPNDRGTRYFNISYCYDPDRQCNLPEGLEFSAVSLSLKSNTILKMYFTDAYNRKVTYYLDGVELEQQDSDGRTLIQITGIPVHMIREDFVVTVKVEGDDTEYSVTYGPAYYIYDIIFMDNDSIEDLKNVMRHLYLYSGSADGYTGNYYYDY